MNTLIQNILQPSLARVGTVVATWLVANGMDSAHGVTIETAVTALGLFAAELVARAVFKKKGDR